MIQQECLLWFDDSPTRSTADKVLGAVARYNQKYGHAPDVCYVHPGSEAEVTSVKVLPAKSILPNHFWLGVQTPTSAMPAGAHSQKRR